MKIIEAMKKIKANQKKVEDLRGLINSYCADLDIEDPQYGSEDKQRAQIKEWLQAHSDILKEISNLKTAIQRTNLETKVKIQLGVNTVEKNVAEWVLRRRDLVKQELVSYERLTDRGLMDNQKLKTTTGGERIVKVRKYFDQKERDEKVASLREEPFLIDAALEIVNATTDLIM